MRKDKEAVVIGSLAVAVFVSLFVFPHPPSSTSFDSLGRILSTYGIAAVSIWIFMEPESRSFKNVIYGSFAVAFYGSILGLFFYELFDFMGF
jgi:hypothetical protein